MLMLVLCMPQLDLTNPATFRDLSRPMGAQTEQRRSVLNLLEL